MASTHGFPGEDAFHKSARSKGSRVRPILKKLAHSEKNSLDLDRGWEEQQKEWSELCGDGGGSSRPIRDVSFDFGARLGNEAGNGNASSNLQHARSASGASHVSAGTSGSLPRGGSFVHPFQQTPRDSTPPLSYANSLASFDLPRDYSPTVTEGEDGLDAMSHPQLAGSSLSHHIPIHHHRTHSSNLSQQTIPRSSFASQRTPSLTELASSAPLRAKATRSTGAVPRIARGNPAASSLSDLHLHLHHPLTQPDSPAVGISRAATDGIAAGGDTRRNCPSPQTPSPPAMSPFRHSFEAGFPRLRSRSEVDTAARAEHIRLARRRFEERERAKEEKYDREQVRKREQRDAKEASRIEREAAALQRKIRKRSGGLGAGGGASDTGAGAGAGDVDEKRPRAQRKSTSRSLPGCGAGYSGAEDGSDMGVAGSSSGPALGLGLLSGVGAAGHASGARGRRSESRKNSGGVWVAKGHAKSEDPEKQLHFMSSNYDSVPGHGLPVFGPGVEDVHFSQAQPRRVRSAKRRTQGYWHGFILWLRTKLLRMSGGR